MKDRRQLLEELVDEALLFVCRNDYENKVSYGITRHSHLADKLAGIRFVLADLDEEIRSKRT